MSFQESDISLPVYASARDDSCAIKALFLGVVSGGVEASWWPHPMTFWQLAFVKKIMVPSNQYERFCIRRECGVVSVSM